MGGRGGRGNTRDGWQKRVWGVRGDGGCGRQSEDGGGGRQIEGAPEEREPRGGTPRVPQEVTVHRERTVNREGTPLGPHERKPERPQAQILKSPINSGLFG